MPYKINGTLLLLQPTTGKWVNRSMVATSGEGRGIYPSVREFEMSWELVSALE